MKFKDQISPAVFQAVLGLVFFGDNKVV